MAFEAFLQQDAGKPKRGRRITYTASIALHAVLLVVGVIYSFWHVEELTPPTLSLSISMAPPPPPPPPPPPKKKSSTKPKTTPQEIVQPKPDQIVQPKEEPPPEEDDSGDEDGEDNGVEGGVKGGVVGGVVGSSGPPVPPPPLPPSPPKMLPPSMGKQQLLSEEMPHMPEALKRVGQDRVVMAKICVGVEGSVASVNLIKGDDPLLDEEVLRVCRGWKYKPYTVDGRSVPFCYVARLTFSVEK